MAAGAGLLLIHRLSDLCAAATQTSDSSEHNIYLFNTETHTHTPLMPEAPYTAHNRGLFQFGFLFFF
jgi:hypothetical protein